MSFKNGVLFVDDDENVLKAIEIKLKSEEYNKYFANSVNKAIEILTISESINVVVSDLSMPDCNGGKLFEYINKYHPLIEKIALSSHTDSTTIISTLNQYAIKAYITKPWKYDKEFIPIIRQAIEFYNNKLIKIAELENCTYEFNVLEHKKEMMEKSNKEVQEVAKKIQKEKIEHRKLLEFLISKVEPIIVNMFNLLKDEKYDKIQEDKVELLNSFDQAIKDILKLEKYIEKNKSDGELIGKNKIMIVDDSKEEILNLSKIITNNTKCKPLGIKNSYEIVRMFGKNKFEDVGLIFLDTIVSGIDGMKLAEMLYKNPETKDIPIIFITSKDLDKVELKLLGKFAYEIISKPFVQEKIVMLINKIFF